MTDTILIKELFYSIFSVPPLQDKLRIVNKGRAISPLPNLITHLKTKTERYARHFCISR